MFIALSLFLPTSVSLLSAVFAKPVSSSDGLSATITGGVTRSSQTLEAPESNYAVHCVPPTRHQTWEGQINATDCKAALFAIDLEVSRFGTKDYTFWSDRYQHYAPLSAWELPYSKSSGRFYLTVYFLFPFSSVNRPRRPSLGSCYVLFRIAKDFGDNVLPLSDRDYLETSTRLALFRNRWVSLILNLRELIECIEVRGQPGWSSVSGDRGILLLLPVSSGMKREWATTNGIVGGMNGTSSDLVNVS